MLNNRCSNINKLMNIQKIVGSEYIESKNINIDILKNKLQTEFSKFDSLINEYTSLIDAYNTTQLTNKLEYLAKKELVKKINNKIKFIVFFEAKISKMQMHLQRSVFIAYSTDRKESPQDLYSVIKLFEDKEFINRNFPIVALLSITNNLQNENNLILRNDFYNSVYVGNYEITNQKIDEKKLQIKISKLNKKIVQCSEKHKYYIQSNNEIWHAKLVKRLEYLSHRKPKNVTEHNSSNIIELTDTSKYYYNKYLAIKVLKEINLKIDKGEFIVILGPSGSGKTTLLNIISGMDRATYGSTLVVNQDLMYKNSSKLTAFRRDYIGYIFQQYGLLSNLNVKENVEIGWNLQKDKSKRIDIDELLKTVGMYEHRNKLPHELSGGQQQRVSVARSMAKNPDIIFGDEPTGAIDENMSKQIMQLFIDINEKFRTTIIIVTHNPIFADLATRVIKVKDGEIFKDYKNSKRKKVSELNWSV